MKQTRMPKKTAPRLVVLMDSIAGIGFKKDSTLAMLDAAQRRGWELWYMEQSDLQMQGAQVQMRVRPLQVRMNPSDWFTLGEPIYCGAKDADVLLMRKDPPFDMEFIYTNYALIAAATDGLRVYNNPQALCLLNEKAALVYFADLAPPFAISRHIPDLLDFVRQQGDAVVKPLDSMGGRSIYRLRSGDSNVPVILEDMTQQGQRTVMVQQFLPAIAEGDKRVFVLDGEPVPSMLRRIPAEGDMRGNLAAGAVGEVCDLGEDEERIARQVGAVLKERGVLFAGLDVIGDRLSEVNITSPTGLREVGAAGCDLADMYMAAIERDG